jgi:hypothetical protein
MPYQTFQVPEDIDFFFKERQTGEVLPEIDPGYAICFNIDFAEAIPSSHQ